MKRLTCLTCVLALAVTAVVGCKKEDQPAAPAEKIKPAEPPKPVEPPKPAPLTGAALLQSYQDCMFTSANTHDIEKSKTCWSQDASLAMPGMPESKGDAITEHLQHFVAAFPDLKIEPVMTLMNGQTVATVVRLSGTNTGPMMDKPATGKPFAMIGLTFDELDEQGKVKHATHVLDIPTMMGQLGMAPPKAKFRALAEAAAPTPPIIATDSPTERDNLALVGKWGDAVAKADWKTADPLMADDVVLVDSGMPTDVKGKKEFEKTMDVGMKAFPDGKWTPVNRFAAGDYVVTLGTFTGTNTGPMPGMIDKPTGKSVTGTGAEVVQVVGGKVAKVWWFGNGAEMAMQLGLMPPPGAPGKQAAPGKEGAPTPAKKEAAPAKGK